MVKRSFLEIRRKIVRALKEMPMSTWDLVRYTGTNTLTIHRHTDYLQQIGVIKKQPFDLRNGKKWLWVLGREKEKNKKLLEW